MPLVLSVSLKTAKARNLLGVGTPVPTLFFTKKVYDEIKRIS